MKKNLEIMEIRKKESENSEKLKKVINLSYHELCFFNGGSELSDAIIRWLGYQYEGAKDKLDDFVASQATDTYRCKI